MNGKIYPYVRVGMRSIEQLPTISIDANGGKCYIPNKDVLVYDTSGPFSDPETDIDIKQGLPRMREVWIKERTDVEQLG